jgi:hypothetical protein
MPDGTSYASVFYRPQYINSTGAEVSRSTQAISAFRLIPAKSVTAARRADG